MAIFNNNKKNKLVSLLQNLLTASSDASVLTKVEIKELLTEYFSTAMRLPEQKTLKMQGEHLSSMRGSGLEFEELRLYQPGDDVRSIDWKTTARLDKPYVRINKKEQSSSVLIYLDFSNSMHFGTQVRLKSSQAARLAVLLIAKCMKQETEITVAVCNGIKTEFYNKKSGSKYILELISDINKSTLKTDAIESQSNFTNSLEGIALLSKTYENVYILSDFKNLSRSTIPAIASLATTGLIKLIKITDPIEYKLPNIGKTNFFDINSNKYLKINTNSSQLRKELIEKMEARDNGHKIIAEEIGLNIDHCSTIDNTMKFFIRTGMNL
ncbi:hypothetical protein PA3071 [hydrothermal vent metagenome]|uniref:DUF58 domain-containing protein n=1 Tax=hydrothermal vent metagenome TaxID=652676 RepID=A0A3B0ZBJ3_9ZZZZ